MASRSTAPTSARADGSRVQPAHAIRRIVESGQQDHRRRVAPLAHFLENVEPRAVRQHDVEDHGVEPRGRQRRKRVGAGGDAVDNRAVKAQAHLQPVRENGIILDDKYAHESSPKFPIVTDFTPTLRLA